MNKHEIVMMSPEALTPYSKNAKRHSKKQLQDLANTIREHGFDQPVVVDADLVIIKGHGRTAACLEHGISPIPVIIRDDLTPEQVKAARIADNQVTSTDYDTVLLQEEIAELDSIGYDIASLGFDERELSMFTEDLVTLDTDSIMGDLEEEMAEVAKKHEEAVREAKGKEIPIAKALGFKSIPGDCERIVARFMASAEAASGKKGVEAFIDLIKRVAA